MTVPLSVPYPPARNVDLPVAVRIVAGSASSLLFALCIYATVRWMLGFSPATPWVRQTALAVHLLTVIPAIPLGAYVILSSKGGPRHRSSGKIWLVLMSVTAAATMFVRNVNDGQFSWIHAFTLLTFVAVPQVIVAARKGQIEAHKRHVRNFFLGALVIAGLTAFMPGRTMWQWAFERPALSTADVD